MSKLIKTTTLLIVLLYVSCISMQAFAAGTVVLFPDKNLEAVVRASIGKAGGDIQKSDVVKITELTADIKGIIKLDGIENCTNLAVLNLMGNKIRKIDKLASLKKLSELYLGNNNISDIAPLNGQTGLVTLSLYDNFITNIMPLAKLTKLTTLDLSNNQVKDIGALASLKSLTTLYLKQNPISNFSATSAYYANLKEKDFTLGAPAQQIKVLINGKETKLSAAPYMSGTVLMLPVKATLEAAGAKVAVSGSKVTITKGTKKAGLTVNSTTASLNGKNTTLEAKAASKNNVVFAPLKKVVEALGGTYAWNAAKKTVTVKMGK
ncbi:MAG: leucine-rich repeat domain-containing protein [Clostridiales bacterium]|nr:leucine-rich repeat domain-containing protein [Clostridiales bacterium]